MPVYLFRCEICGPDKDQEVFLEYGEASTLPWCPACKQHMRKVFTAPAIHFRGGGWGSSN